jgi:hypothetical protein
VSAVETSGERDTVAHIMFGGEKLRSGEETVSFHWRRRNAREEADRLEALQPGNQYTVRSTMRGPFGWRVVRRAPRRRAART